MILLSKLSLRDPYSPFLSTKKDVEAGHKIVMSLFPELENKRASGNILWRLESNHPIPYVLIQSEVGPCLDNLRTDGYARYYDLETKKLPILELANLETVSYNVRLNPTVTKNILINGVVKTTRVNLNTSAEIENWWFNKSVQLGLDCTEQDFAVVLEEKVGRYSRTNDSKYKKLTNNFSSVNVSGIAKIIDQKAVLDTIQTGVGKAKNYGFGLMLLGKNSIGS